MFTITQAQLLKITPRVPRAILGDVLKGINGAFTQLQVSEPKEAAMFVAQTAHESNEYLWFEELATGAAYEGRKDLGNIYLGDGARYKGRGPIQLTGRANYVKFTAWAKARGINIDFVAHPHRVAEPELGFLAAVFYWETHVGRQGQRIGPLAKAGDVTKVTRLINGGLNGYVQRKRYYDRALPVLSAPQEVA